MALKPLKIPFGEMKGLMQAVDDNLLSLSYSPDCQNFRVDNGILSTVKGSTKLNNTALTGRTIKRLFKFEGTTGHGLIIGTENATGNRKWYYMRSPDNELYEITTTGGASLEMSPFATRAEQFEFDGRQHMILVDGLRAVKIWQSDAISGALTYAPLGGSPPSGAHITSHRNRIWMSSGNTLYYSNAFDPEDWSTAGETGEIILEVTDGDVITEIDNIFDDVVIFMRNSIWRISGDIPSEYAVEKIYAVQGSVQKDGICTDGNYSYFIGMDGIYRYDGTTGIPVAIDEIKNYISLIHPENVNKMLILLNSRLYLMDIKGGLTYYGKHLVYDSLSKKIEVISMQDVLAATYSQNRFYGSEVGYLYYSDGSYIYYLDDTKLLFDTLPIAAYWNTPETDLGYPHAEKTITGLYFNGWGTDNAGNAGGQVKITAYYKGMNGVQKTKEKIVTLSTTRKQHDVRLGITGRLFKFKFENVNGSAINLSGITLTVELAED